MNLAATIKQVINRRWILKLFTLNPLVVVAVVAVCTGVVVEVEGGTVVANSAVGVPVVVALVKEEGDVVGMRDRL